MEEGFNYEGDFIGSEEETSDLEELASEEVAGDMPGQETLPDNEIADSMPQMEGHYQIDSYVDACESIVEIDRAIQEIQQVGDEVLQGEKAFIVNEAHKMHSSYEELEGWEKFLNTAEKKEEISREVAEVYRTNIHYRKSLINAAASALAGRDLRKYEELTSMFEHGVFPHLRKLLDFTKGGSSELCEDEEL